MSKTFFGLVVDRSVAFKGYRPEGYRGSVPSKISAMEAVTGKILEFDSVSCNGDGDIRLTLPKDTPSDLRKSKEFIDLLRKRGVSSTEFLLESPYHRACFLRAEVLPVEMTREQFNVYWGIPKEDALPEAVEKVLKESKFKDRSDVRKLLEAVDKTYASKKKGKKV